MPLLSLDSVSVGTATTPLLDTVSALLVSGECVGLVGRNGSGKSTLLSVLASSSPAASTGRTQKPDDDLDQEEDPDADGEHAARKGGDSSDDAYFTVTSGSISGELAPSVREPGSVLLVRQDTLSWADLFPDTESEDELREMTLPDAFATAMAYGLEYAIEDEEAWTRQYAVAAEGLSWDLADYDNTPLGKLSPGCALRAYLAVALHRADVRLLLLDEPTNHLDLPSILWLQGSMKASKKTFIVVSHDEAFLDAVTDHIWEIDSDTLALTVSGARYSSFKQAKELARDHQKKAYDEQQKRHEKLTSVANNLRLASKRGEHHHASDRDKLQRDFRRDRAGRSGKKAAAVEKLRDSEAVVERVVEHVPLRIRLDPVAAGNDSAIVLDQAVLGVPGDWGVAVPLSLPPLSLRADYGERIAIIGFNGVGKSTLLRTVMGETAPLSGKVSVGRELRVGNLTQEHASLPRDVSARSHIAAVTGLDPFTGGSRVINYGLSRFQVDQPMGELNPGARARLLLATFSFRNVNTLVLDEPTNHLDEEAIGEITASLNTYAGTVLVVSHDRAFLNALHLTRTFSLTREDGLVEIPSIDAFVDDIEDKVQAVVAATATV